jgi:hypothetical protein
MNNVRLLHPSKLVLPTAPTPYESTLQSRREAVGQQHMMPGPHTAPHVLRWIQTVACHVLRGRRR